jgi:hypothetical protein
VAGVLTTEFFSPGKISFSPTDERFQLMKKNSIKSVGTFHPLASMSQQTVSALSV